MQKRVHLGILRQPDDYTCGPTCLHAVYRYYNDTVPLEEVIAETPCLKNRGTMAVMLACQALRRGYRATMYTYNLQLFDPTWFTEPGVNLAEKLESQAESKTGARFRASTQAYMEYLERGGTIRFENLTAALIRRHLNRFMPILTGLSATYLYGCAREFGPSDDYDDIRGEPSGHFVVLYGYNKETRTVLVADPLHPNPVSETQHYEVNIDRLIAAIFLGVLTYDANLLILQPGRKKGRRYYASPNRRQQS